MNKLGVNYTARSGLTHEESFAIFQRLGFEAIFTGYNGVEGTARVAALAAEHNLFYESIHAPFDGINAMWNEDNQEAEDMYARILACVDACRANSIPITVVHLSAGQKPPQVNDRGLARFDRLVAAAEDAGVKIAFENLRSLANLAVAMERYADSPAVGFCWDIGHETCFAHGMEFMPLFGDRLICTHIQDNRLIHNQDNHMIPFDGRIDFERRMNLLRRYSYTGTLMLELLPDKCDYYAGWDMERYYARAYDAIIRLRNMLNR